MKTVVKNIIEAVELAEIFQVEVVDGQKRVNRWGFFVNHGDGTCAVYKPKRPICHVDEYFMIEEDGPGDILTVDRSEINNFLSEIGNELQGIAGSEVSAFTPCGWYYDTIA